MRRDAEQQRAQHWFVASTLVAMLVCATIAVTTSFAAKGSAKPLASQARMEVRADDQLVMLDEYQYDLPFYLGMRRPAWVLSDWADPTIPKKDNWRKEVFDAGQFDPKTAATNLVSAQGLIANLCRLQSGSAWIWGQPKAASALPWLAQRRPWATDGKHLLWRLPAGEIRSLPACAGTPTAG